MILADTSIWIDHFKLANPILTEALDEDKVLMHAYVVGELSLGSLRDRHRTLSNFEAFDYAPVAQPHEVLSLIENAALFNRGLGYIDVHLLASCLIHGGCRLLSRDRRLREAAEQLGIAA